MTLGKMAVQKILLFCLQAVFVASLGQAFSLPGAFNSEAIITNNVVSNANLYGKPLPFLSNVGVNEIVTSNNIISNNYGNPLTGNYINTPLLGVPNGGINEIVTTNNVLSTNVGPTLSGTSINDVVSTSNVLSTNFSPFSGGLANGLTSLPNVGLTEIITSNNFAPTFSGITNNPSLMANGLSNKILGANIGLSGNLLNSGAFLPNSTPLLPLSPSGYISEIVPNLQIGDISVTGDMPVGGTIKVCGCFPVYGVVAVDGAVPSAGSAVVNTGGSFVIENGCGCNNQLY